jgi:phosphoribosylformylglycinamidine synthase
MGQEPARLHSAQQLKQFFQAMQALHAADLVLAYHDRSDGGLLATVAEMMFAGHLGVDLYLPESVATNEFLFHEGLGAVLQVAESQLDTVLTILDGHQLQDAVYPLGGINNVDALRIYRSDESLCYERSRVELGRVWSKTSYEMQKLRDNPETAQAEYDRWLDADDPGLSEFIADTAAYAPGLVRGVHGSREQVAGRSEEGVAGRSEEGVAGRSEEGVARRSEEGIAGRSEIEPRVAILREQGVNGQAEMAAAFAYAGFTVVDVHMDDLLSGRQTLDSFVGLAACGGFSYGDVLGAGRGWAQVILNHAELKEQFRAFFADKSKFALGVCNGCQMLSQLKAIIPGADHWPRFVHNRSGRFESRMCLVKVNESPSIFLRNMEGSVISVVAAHGEGLVQASPSGVIASKATQSSACLSYVNNRHELTESYPANPNGSAGGQTAFCNDDGRILIMMPHPERVFLQQQQTWRSDTAMGDSPWAQFFRNAREFVSRT